MSGDLKKIEMLYDSLRPSEKKIADYIFENPEQISELSISELARNCNTSEASVVRFCKTLGYEGYIDFRIKFAASLALRYKKIQGVVDVEDSPKEIIAKISKNNMQSINNTMEILDEDEVEKAANAILNAKKVDIYGVGASSIVAQDAQQKFVRINKPCTYYQDINMQFVSASNLTEEDVALGISYSGETIDIVRAMEVAKNTGATTICITKFGNTPITEVSDIKLFVSSNEAFFRSAAMASRIAQLNVIDILFSIVTCKNYDVVIKYLENTGEAVIDRKY